MPGRPVANHWPISARFGWNASYPANNGWHFGLDYATPAGTPFWCREGGTVTIASKDAFPPAGLMVYGSYWIEGCWGRYIEVQGDSGTIWGFAHASDVLISVGQRIEAGEVLGLSGGDPSDPLAGVTTGPHLHEQAIVNTVRVDPDSIVLEDDMQSIPESLDTIYIVANQLERWGDDLQNNALKAEAKKLKDAVFAVKRVISRDPTQP